ASALGSSSSLIQFSFHPAVLEPHLQLGTGSPTTGAWAIHLPVRVQVQRRPAEPTDKSETKKHRPDQTNLTGDNCLLIKAKRLNATGVIARFYPCEFQPPTNPQRPAWTTSRYAFLEVCLDELPGGYIDEPSIHVLPLLRRQGLTLSSVFTHARTPSRD
ncbi:hypothetical protein CSHISOI_03293, partial [Colletotrichum shisoi]